MNLNSISTNQLNLNFMRSTNVKSGLTAETSFSINKNEVTTEVSSTEESHLTSNVYEEIGSKYDVRNATFEEFSEIANTLYEAGEITFLQSSLMRFDYDRATRELKSELGNKVAPDFSLYETYSDSSGRRDWISEWEARLSKDMRYDVMGFHHTQGILKVLKRLENN